MKSHGHSLVFHTTKSNDLKKEAFECKMNQSVASLWLLANFGKEVFRPNVSVILSSMSNRRGKTKTLLIKEFGALQR